MFFLCFFNLFLVFKVFSLGRVALYTVFMVFSLPQTLVRNLAKKLVKNLAQKLSDKLTDVPLPINRLCRDMLKLYLKVPTIEFEALGVSKGK